MGDMSVYEVLLPFTSWNYTFAMLPVVIAMCCVTLLLGSY